MAAESRPLAGLRVVSLAVYIPGPLTAARLQAFGAAVTTVEPPEGDPLEPACPAWYAALHAGQEVLRLNLRDPADRARLDARLAAADLLLTAVRPAALVRLDLAGPALRARYPALCHVAIVGYPGAAADHSGHDLTYQAAAGLLDPPHLPRALVADFAGAAEAVSAALALLLARERGHGPGAAEVALSAAGADYAAALRYGLTAPDGLLGGGYAGYGLYATADGWIAVAALEPRYRAALAAALGAPITRAALTAHFAAAPTAHWVAWAAAHDVPLVPLADPGAAR